MLDLELKVFLPILTTSDAPEPRLGSVLARAFKKKARLGLLNISGF